MLGPAGILRGMQVTIDDDVIYRLNENVFSVPMPDENIVLEMGSEKYFGVRGAMRHLLDGLRGGLSLEAMIAQTCERYSVAPAVAREDIEAMLPKLIAVGIVERAA